MAEQSVTHNTDAVKDEPMDDKSVLVLVHVKNEPADSDGEAVGDDKAHVTEVVVSPDVATVKQELDIGLTVLQPPDKQFTLQTCEPGPSHKTLAANSGGMPHHPHNSVAEPHDARRKRSSGNKIGRKEAPLTSAEKSRRYREKLKETDPERYSLMKKRSSERVLQRYREKKANMDEQQKEELRAKWRENNKKTKEQSHSHRLHNGNSQVELPHNIPQNVTSKNANNSNQLDERNMQKLIERSLRNENTKLHRAVKLLQESHKSLLTKVENQQKLMSEMNKKLDMLIRDKIEPGNKYSA